MCIWFKGGRGDDFIDYLLAGKDDVACAFPGIFQELFSLLCGMTQLEHFYAISLAGFLVTPSRWLGPNSINASFIDFY